MIVFYAASIALIAFVAIRICSYYLWKMRADRFKRREAAKPERIGDIQGLGSLLRVDAQGGDTFAFSTERISTLDGSLIPDHRVSASDAVDGLFALITRSGGGGEITIERNFRLPVLRSMPEDKLSPQLLIQANNHDRELLVEKIGIERCVDELGESMDKQDDYELINLELFDGEKRPYLKMKNPSVDIWHVEGVDERCETVQDAINWRAYGDECWIREQVTQKMKGYVSSISSGDNGYAGSMEIPSHDHIETTTKGSRWNYTLVPSTRTIDFMTIDADQIGALQKALYEGTEYEIEFSTGEGEWIRNPDLPDWKPIQLT